MGRNNIETWAASLVVGEDVVSQNPITGEKIPAKVLGVTPKGVVKTTRGDFKYPGIGDKLVGYNGTMGWLLPKGDFEVITAAEVKMGKKQQKKEVKLFCAAVVAGDVEMSDSLIESMLILKRKFA